MAFQDVVLAIGCVRGVGWVIGFILRHLLLLVRTGHKRGENIKGEEEEKRKKKKRKGKLFLEIGTEFQQIYRNRFSTSIPCNNFSLEPRALKARPREI